MNEITQWIENLSEVEYAALVKEGAVKELAKLEKENSKRIEFFNSETFAFIANKIKEKKVSIDNDVNFIFFYPNADYEHVSSSALRELKKYPSLAKKITRYLP